MSPSLPDPATETCRIRRWRGYATSTFYAESDLREVLAESRSFRWRKEAPPPETPSARTAYDELVAALVADGWEPLEERGADWFATTFRRPRRTPLPVVAYPHAAPAPPELVYAPQPLPPTPAPEVVDPAPARPREVAPSPPTVETSAPTAAPPARAPAPAADVPAPPNQRRRRFMFAAGAVAVVGVGAAAMPASRQLESHAPAAAAAQQPKAKAPARPTTPPAKAAATAKRAKPAAATTSAAPAAQPPATRVRPPLVDVRISAHGNGSWVEIRRGSKTGPSLYSSVLADGRKLHFRGRRLWARFGAAGNLTIVANGKPVKLGGTYEKLFVPPKQ